MGPRVTWEASPEGKKLLINYDDWKIGLIVMSPEQNNANRECTHIFLRDHSEQLFIAQES